MFNSLFCANRRSVVEGHFKKNELDSDHDRCLDEQGFIVVGSEPVEDPAQQLVLGLVDRDSD
jgi:hypothetical protein